MWVNVYYQFSTFLNRTFMKKGIVWVLAVVITLFAAYYQRKTGPTHPKKETIEVSNQEYDIQFPRSQGGDDNATILLETPDNIEGVLSYHRYPTNENWIVVKMKRTNEGLFAELPNQPPAGKLEYFVKLSVDNEEIFNNSVEPIVIRFKGNVPAYILIPHILFMFLAMLFSSFTGISALMKNIDYKKFGVITLVLLFLGGGILGPIVQKFAFGEFWTGVPFGWDLTDNKTLISMIGWAVAVFFNIKKERPVLTVIAAVLLLLIYSIPHSMFGSQLNPETGEVIQGFITNVFVLF